MKTSDCNSPECNSIEHNFDKMLNIYPNLSAVSISNQRQFRINKVNEIKYYFVTEIKKRKLMRKRLSKCITLFDYFDKSLTVLSVRIGSISIASFATVIGASVEITSVNLSLAFLISTEIIKMLLKATRNKEEKYKIFMLARTKLNSIKEKYLKC